jgi:beta-1,4-mannooligosaccharide/beta-1,4-mannosyl-N-acetylglucosamine phosphorylase
MIRHPRNPILTRVDIPVSDALPRDVSSVFNPGGIKLGGEYVLLLRVQDRGRRTLFVRAASADGVNFRVDGHPVAVSGLEAFPHEIYHLYDPRVTRLEGRIYVTCAIDCAPGCRSALFETDDCRSLRYLGLLADADLRNAVLFPERIGGSYLLFARPNDHLGADGVRSGATIVCYASPDLLNWEPVAPVFSGRPHYWDELLGSGPPPLKTSEGWLHIYHGVATHFASVNIYQAGVSLHDGALPWNVLARSAQNILEPRESWELSGQVPNVVFPSAAIPESVEADGTVLPGTRIFIYYGAADTCVGLAVATAGELLAACREP